MDKKTKAKLLEDEAKRLRKEAEEAEVRAELEKADAEFEDYTSPLNEKEVKIAEFLYSNFDHSVEDIIIFFHQNKVTEDKNYIVSSYNEHSGGLSLETKEEVIELIKDKITCSYSDSFSLSIYDLDGNQIRNFKVDF